MWRPPVQLVYGYDAANASDFNPLIGMQLQLRHHWLLLLLLLLRTCHHLRHGGYGIGSVCVCAC